eukprot:2237260-Ditylum_brightwellii.AAC.1
MDIDNYAEAVTNNAFVTPMLRARCHAQFHIELSYGVDNMRIYVFGTLNTGSQNPGCILCGRYPRWTGINMLD